MLTDIHPFNRLVNHTGRNPAHQPGIEPATLRLPATPALPPLPVSAGFGLLPPRICLTWPSSAQSPGSAPSPALSACGCSATAAPELLLLGRLRYCPLRRLAAAAPLAAPGLADSPRPPCSAPAGLARPRMKQWEAFKLGVLTGYLTHKTQTYKQLGAMDGEKGPSI